MCHCVYLLHVCCCMHDNVCILVMCLCASMFYACWCIYVCLSMLALWLVHVSTYVLMHLCMWVIVFRSVCVGECSCMHEILCLHVFFLFYVLQWECIFSSCVLLCACLCGDLVHMWLFVNAWVSLCVCCRSRVCRCACVCLCVIIRVYFHICCWGIFCSHSY